MYEETKNSIDWKGIFLKVIIAFLIVLIGVKGYTTLKGNDKKVNNTTNATAESKSSLTFTANIEKLRNAGEKYYKENQNKIPKTEGTTSMITLKELVTNGVIENLTDENGKTCDVESSYVTATLEGKKTKIKANLVCGDASSYSLVYMGLNDKETKTETTKTETSKTETSKTNNKTTVTNSSSTSSKKENTTVTNSCGTSCGTPVVNVKTETKAEQSVIVNKQEPSTTTTTTTVPVKYYTVKFYSRGGNTDFADQTVKENEKAYNPGNPIKNNYRFIGWYLDGRKYDFSTPVTRNIQLEARYVTYDNTNDYYDNYYYEDDWYNYNNNYNNYYTGTTNGDFVPGRKSMSTVVYSMAWDEYGTNSVYVRHTLRLPKTIANDTRASKVRIAKVEALRGITTPEEIRIFNNNHASTFLYSKNGWEAKNILEGNLAKINKNNITLNTSYDYKYIDDAISEGFDVEWYVNRVSSQCEDRFSVNNVDNLCDYGIVYRVYWEYL